MARILYQSTLLTLQFALVVALAPSLAQGLMHDLAIGAFAGGALVAVQIAAALGAIGGGALALTFPLFALLRHRQRGRARFGGLPRWSVALALAGGLTFAAGALLNGAAALMAEQARLTALLTARPLLDAGLALMAAGVLSAELLRRSVGVPRVIVVARDRSTERIEVTHPPELATQVP